VSQIAPLRSDAPPTSGRAAFPRNSLACTHLGLLLIRPFRTNAASNSL
jgi:hypothetical protein